MPGQPTGPHTYRLNLESEVTSNKLAHHGIIYVSFGCLYLVDLRSYYLTNMFDLFPNALEYPCIHHRSHNASHLCSESNCSAHPFFCQYCLSDSTRMSPHSGHQENIIPIPEAIASLSQSIDDKKVEIDKINKNVLGKVDVDALLKKLQDGDQACRVMDSHVKGLKTQIQRESDQLMVEFEKKLQQNKQSLFGQLDNYQRIYAQNIQSCREMIQPLASFKRNIKFYSNPNNVLLKLHSELKKKSAEWYIHMKKMVFQIYRVSERVHSLGDSLAKVSQSLGNSDDVPYMKAVDFNESSKLRLNHFINECINDKIVIRQIKPVNDASLQEEYRGGNQKPHRQFY